MRMGISLVENLLPHETVTAPESGSIPHHIRRMYAVTIGTRNENDRRLIEIAWRPGEGDDEHYVYAIAL
jgi:hypothetical protein